MKKAQSTDLQAVDRCQHDNGQCRQGRLSNGDDHNKVDELCHEGKLMYNTKRKE